MLSLKSMRADEYSDFLDYFIPDYAVEISANYGLTNDDARVRARKEINQDLPQGIDTPGQTLVCIVEMSTDTALGYLWYRTNLEIGDLFIYDFHIFAAHQGKGYGKLALALLETEAAKLGLRQIKLRVAQNNSRAKHVYDGAGFQVTGINMSKQIVQQRGD